MKAHISQFVHPLSETSIVDGVDTMNSWACAGYWSYHACNGNEKAISIIRHFVIMSNPTLNTTLLLEQAKNGSDSTIMMLINAVADGLDRSMDFQLSL